MFVDKSCPPVTRVLNAADNLKAIRATHSFLDHKENFTKACFDMFLNNYFATNFNFHGSVGIKSA